MVSFKWETSFTFAGKPHFLNSVLHRLNTTIEKYVGLEKGMTLGFECPSRSVSKMMFTSCPQILPKKLTKSGFFGTKCMHETSFRLSFYSDLIRNYVYCL